MVVSAKRRLAHARVDGAGFWGIFAKVLTKCKIDTFNSCLTYTPEGGYKVWFTLHLSLSALQRRLKRHGDRQLLVRER